MNESLPPGDDVLPREELESRVKELEEELQELKEFLAPFMAAETQAIRAFADPA